MTFNAFYGNSFFMTEDIYKSQFPMEPLREVKSNLPDVEKLREVRPIEPNLQTPPVIPREYNSGFISGNSIFFNYA